MSQRDPVIEVDGDRATGRWFLLTLLIDPDTQEAAWSVATLDYEYARESDGWRFKRNHCVHEHLLSPYDRGWGRSGGSKLPSAAEGTPPEHLERIRRQGGKQRPGRLTRSIRGWSVRGMVRMRICLLLNKQGRASFCALPITRSAYA